MKVIKNKIKRIRLGCFETNSSSMHSVTVSNKDRNFNVDISCPPDGILRMEFGEFGWEQEWYSGSKKKLQYALTMAAETEKFKTKEEFYETAGFKMCNEMVKRLISGCEGIEITSKVTTYDGTDYVDFDGYIDHQSSTDRYGSLQDFLDDYGLTLEEFVFDYGVTLITDNDNH